MVKLRLKEKKQNQVETMKKDGTYVYAVGRRKRAIASVRVFVKGSGDIVINGKPLKEYFPTEKLQNKVTDPLKLSGKLDQHDITVFTEGGGITGQAESVRLGISRALVKMEEELRTTLKGNGFLSRDPRKKERKKPGLKRARRAPQWSKR